MVQTSVFWDRFLSFFEVALRVRPDSQREGTNLCFCRQVQYFQVLTLGSEIENRPRLAQHCSHDAPRRSHTQKTQFFRFRARLGVDFGLLGMLPDPPRRSVCVPGRLWELSGHARDVPRTSRDASWGRPRMLQGPENRTSDARKGFRGAAWRP